MESSLPLTAERSSMAHNCWPGRSSENLVGHATIGPCRSRVALNVFGSFNDCRWSCFPSLFGILLDIYIACSLARVIGSSAAFTSSMVNRLLSGCSLLLKNCRSNKKFTSRASGEILVLLSDFLERASAIVFVTVPRRHSIE